MRINFDELIHRSIYSARLIVRSFRLFQSTNLQAVQSPRVDSSAREASHPEFIAAMKRYYDTRHDAKKKVNWDESNPANITLINALSSKMERKADKITSKDAMSTWKVSVDAAQTLEKRLREFGAKNPNSSTAKFLTRMVSINEHT
jgi:hypothetical protein